MTKAELVNLVNQKVSTSYGSNVQRVDATLDALAEVVTTALKTGGEVPIPGLGKLVVKQRKARTGRNPKTGERIEITAKSAAIFRPGKALTDALN